MKLTIEIAENNGDCFRTKFFYTSEINKISPEKEHGIKRLIEGERLDNKKAERIKRYALLDEEIIKTVERFYERLNAFTNKEDTSPSEP